MNLASDIPLCVCAPFLQLDFSVFSRLEPEAESIISKEKNTVCHGDPGFHNVELWATEVSCLGSSSLHGKSALL